MGSLKRELEKKLNLIFLVMKVNKHLKNTKSYAVKSEI